MEETLLHYSPIPSVLCGCTVTNSIACFFLLASGWALFETATMPYLSAVSLFFPGSLTVFLSLQNSLDLCQIWGICRRAHAAFSLMGIAWQSLNVELFHCLAGKGLLLT